MDREHFIFPMESNTLNSIMVLNLSENIRMVIGVKELSLGEMETHILEVIKTIKNGQV